jgi:ribosome modulation factor
MARDTPNPYRKAACPDLYAAWDEGYQAYLAGESVPDEHLERPSAAANAWLNGYTAARLSNSEVSQPGAATPE